MRFQANEIRRDGEYGVEFDAPDWEAARAICEHNAWALSGELKAVIPASDAFGEKEADQLSEAANEARASIRH